MSSYFAHQPWLLACRASASIRSRSCGSVTPYRLSRSETSRSLKPTRPCSTRLILDREARISYPAWSGVRPAASRRRRSWIPSSIRRTVGPPRGCPPLICPGPMLMGDSLPGRMLSGCPALMSAPGVTGKDPRPAADYGAVTPQSRELSSRKLQCSTSIASATPLRRAHSVTPGKPGHPRHFHPFRRGPGSGRKAIDAVSRLSLKTPIGPPPDLTVLAAGSGPRAGHLRAAKAAGRAVPRPWS